LRAEELENRLMPSTLTPKPLLDINPGIADSSFKSGTGLRESNGTAAVAGPLLEISSTTSVSASPNPAGFGQTVTFTATVSGGSGLITPTGTVDFKEGSTDLTPGGVTLTAGQAFTASQATFSTSSLALGSHTITAFYSGDSFFPPSHGDDSADPEIVVNPATTAVSSTPNPSVFGQAVTFTATVSNGGTAIPTGTVDFKEGGTDLTPGGVSLTAGQATFSTSSLALGSNTVTALYSGDTVFIASQGNDSANPQVVQKAAGTTTVTSSPDPTGLGQAVTFTATVAQSGPAIPTGTVDFKEGNTDLTPGGVSLTAGQATFSIGSLGLGSHTITALYGGDNNFLAGQGDDSANPHVVNRVGILGDTGFTAIPHSFTQVNDVTFFSEGGALWASTITDGISQVGSFASDPAYLTNVNGRLFFVADDGVHGKQLWIGTEGGAHMVEDINPGPSGSNPSNLTNVDGLLFFTANDGTHGVELWASVNNGTATGLVKDINPGPGDSDPQFLTNVDGLLFFIANDGTHGFELWESQITPTGFDTFMVDTAASPFLPSPFVTDLHGPHLTNVNGTLFFAADDGVHGTELWESDGTATGTFMVADINPGQYGSFPYNLTNVNGTLFFQADDGTHGTELWESNGTAAGTVLVQDINPHPSTNFQAHLYNLTNVSGTLFFFANDGTHGFQLWESNGTTAGTFMVRDIGASASPSPSYLTNVNGILFFSAVDGAHGSELWQSNGSAAGTILVQDINPGPTSSYPKYLTNVNGTLFFAANDGSHGGDPWILVNTATTTAVSSTPNPSAFGQAVTFTATVGVTPGLPAPIGTVDFKDGGTDLTPGGVTLVGGQATFSTTALGAGSDTIAAVYSGDVNFQASQGDDSAKPQVVQKDSTAVTLLTSPSTLVSGQPVAVAAVVANTSGPFGTPTGQVQFSVDGTKLGSPVTLVGGVASHLPTTLLATGGPHTITATYTNSDGNFLGSSKSVIQAVGKDGTRTILASTPITAVAGQVVVFTAAIVPVAPGSGIPTGTVDFKDGATDLTPGGISLSAGRAFFTTSSLGLGHHTVTASYSGDASFTGSSGNDVNSLVVNQASSRTVMTAFPDPAVFGQVVSFTVAVPALAPSQGTPTGTVAFTDGTTTIGSVTLNNVGRATFTTASLSRGNHAINASYQGDAKFLSSSHTGFGETVLQDATTATVTASANPAVVGTTVTFTAVVQANSPGAGKATGSVVFKDFTTALATLTLNGAGQATFTTSALALGTHAITATYAGDTNFLASVSALLAESVKSMTLATAASGVVSAPLAKSPAIVQSAATAPLPRPLASTSVDNYFASGQGHSWRAAPTIAKLRRPTPETDWLG
jgi:large repetitive protein